MRAKLLMASFWLLPVISQAQTKLPLPQTLEEVERASKDPCEDVRMTAVSTVGKYQDHPKECAAIVSRLMRDSSDEVSHRASTWIMRMGVWEPRLIQEGLDHHSYNVAQFSMSVIMNLKTAPDAAWLPRLRYWLSFSSQGLTRAAMARYGDTINLAEEVAESEKVRKARERRVAEAVAGKTDAALRDLADILEHGDEYSASTAAEAAGEGRDESVIRVLLKSSRATRGSRRIWILRALPVDDPKWSEQVLEAVVDALSDVTNMGVRQAATMLARSKDAGWIRVLATETEEMELSATRRGTVLGELGIVARGRQFGEVHRATAAEAFLKVAEKHRDLASLVFDWLRQLRASPIDENENRRVDELEKKFKALK